MSNSAHLASSLARRLTLVTNAEFGRWPTGRLGIGAMNPKKQHRRGQTSRPDSGEDEATPRGPPKVAQGDMRDEFLARSIEVFRLRMVIREHDRKGAGDEGATARRAFAEHVRKVTQQRGKSVQELHLKTQILCVLVDFDMPDLCRELARSIRDDAGLLCQPHARSGRHED
jgi:hypothetical protein